MNFMALDVAIGLILIYFMLSLAVLAINEGIATIINFRARTLKGGIDTLVGAYRALETKTAAGDAKDKAALEQERTKNKTKGQALRDRLYQHPLFDALHERGIFGGSNRSPSYIPSKTFVLSLLDVIASPDGGKPAAIGTGKDLVAALEHAQLPEPLTRQLRLVVQDAGDDLAKVKAAMESWFGNAMERVSATYKARIQTIGFFVALAVTFIANANTLTLVQALTVNPALRAAVVAQAQEAARVAPSIKQAGDTTRLNSDSLLQRSSRGLEAAREIGLPLGFPERTAADRSAVRFYGKHIWNGIGGLLITAMAVSLGAPFWFDLLNKVVNVRGAGKAPEEKSK